MRFGKIKLVAAAALVVMALASTVGAASAADRTTELFNRIRTVYEVVAAYHKDGADLDTFTSGAIRGGLEALGDPYTNYFTPEEYTDFINSLNGSFSGIGAYLEQDGNYVTISSPIKGSPAHAAGLATGDRILEVDGTPLIGATTDKAVKLIRGTPGTSVTLKIERPSEKRIFTVTIVRAQINIPEVESKMLDGDLGYIQLSSFGDDAVSSFYAAVASLKQQGAKGLVLDIRQNGGGYLNAAVDIASAFVPKGEPVVWEVGKGGKSVIASSGRLINLPVVLLVDNGSASASEILAGAIQDYGVAPLVGTKTFGKGTVQTILSFTTGGGIKVTVAEYLTPKERHVNKAGLTPDVVVENPKMSDRTSPLEFKRILFPNYAGLDVQDLQYRLEYLGYAPETTGYFGMNTVDAVLKFAHQHRLPNEAVVGEEFISALNADLAYKLKNEAKQDLQLKKATEILREKLAK